ncbi:GNAT family N-acetyltransferase [Streptomyces sp. Pv4-95]|uniref:GNAT family N-acetyltransferase n=1 Tax=Streptomyces sp. Pv4-95 TaxID=3049543 RepID=UPI00389187DD
MNAVEDSAEVTVRAATGDLQPVVERLAQLERHDLSEFRGTGPYADGRFHVGELPLFFTGPGRAAHLIHHGSRLAGFALTRRLDAATSLSAFFVVRALRRRRVGHRAALELLRRQPGPWAIAFQEDNPAAAPFWRKVATAAVGPAWHEERRPVLGHPELPPDVWLLFDTSGQR